jgi:hypothetical protein
MVLKFIKDRARYNLLIASERREYLQMSDTATGNAAQDPRNGGGSS